MTPRSPFRSVLLIASLLLCMGPHTLADPQQRRGFVPVANEPLKTEQIVKSLVKRNLEQVRTLHGYLGTRTYRVDYRGFPGVRTAEMIVDVKYQSPGIKEFTIRSATGSTIIINKVFRKLLQAEKEASSTEAQRRTALNSDNYNFTQIGYENTPSGLMYVLAVEPKAKDKFLYQGRIWVDAADFAVARLEAQPAKNPSFWTKNGVIEQVYTKVSQFWLPARNHSISEIRLGGSAELTIHYNDYQILGAEGINNLQIVESAHSTDTASAQR